MVHPYHPWVQPPPHIRHVPSPVMLRLHHGKRILSRTSARLTRRDSQQSQRGNSPRHHYQPPDLLGKSSSAYFWRRRKTPYPLRLCSELLRPSPRCCETPHHGERSEPNRRPLDPTIKLLNRDIQRLIQQEAQDQWRTLLESSKRATNRKR